MLKVAGGFGIAIGALSSVASTEEDSIHPGHHPWGFNGPLDTYDAAAIRRGHMVYTSVCAACHSMDRIAYRNLIGVCYTEAEAKKLAEAIEVEDGPNDEGEMFERAGKLSDYFPNPYKSEEEVADKKNIYVTIVCRQRKLDIERSETHPLCQVVRES